MKMSIVRAALSAWTLLPLGITAASAAPITVINPSFEIIPPGGLPLTSGCQGAGCSYNAGPGSIPGWTNSGFSGEFIAGVQVGNHFAFDFMPDGIAGAYTNTAGPSIISQTVTETVQLGITYTLEVDFGLRHDAPSFSPATADLLINGIQYSATGVAPSPGSWSTFTATYIGLATDVGDPITIALGSTTTGFPTQPIQADFDNVRLSSNTPSPPIPEPSSIELLGAALVGAGAFARRKRHIPWCQGV
jgi:hypothetical protein